MFDELYESCFPLDTASRRTPIVGNDMILVGPCGAFGGVPCMYFSLRYGGCFYDELVTAFLFLKVSELLVYFYWLFEVFSVDFRAYVVFLAFSIVSLFSETICPN